ncbi:TrkH family potassium uptake protein [Anianabacter salinae]|uniref:TrkH family potassium uptake protein n=1 Tax=Anianabacter salinae TaxID=2851023 RepID=UPI00225E1F42|nr:potassium transporter TrkG [Anianabacter salinae]MBV0912126.1 TrkH family potassium uptake protein [Anianabacter salinae]
MLARILGLPLIVILIGIASLSMAVPALVALGAGDRGDAVSFGFGLVVFSALSVLLAIATWNHETDRPARSYLLSLLAAFTVLPLVLAVPFHDAVGNTGFFNAYWEMLSSLTTTGATLYPDPARLSATEHLWRGLVAWQGGFLFWITAVAILAPMNLGGFEVLSPAEAGQGATAQSGPITSVASGSQRLQGYSVQLLPVYVGLTLALWVSLVVLGDPPLVAAIHAMSTMSTSGISPIGGADTAVSGVRGEVVIFIFLFFAISRQTFTRDRPERGFVRLATDPEFRMGLGCAVAVPAFLFLRHWFGAIEGPGDTDLGTALNALWGSIFTVMSFLSTTGFVSSEWGEAQVWSGFRTPGLLLMGLALIGGGVATTAGGVKLLRVYALYSHGLRELEKLVLPNSVGGSGPQARRIRRQGAYVAWIFFMLFAMSIAVIMLALSMTGIAFEPAVILTIASLSTTGPLIEVAGGGTLTFATLGDAAKAILAAAMVLGRLETLAIIAILNPEFWRR